MLPKDQFLNDIKSQIKLSMSFKNLAFLKNKQKFNKNFGYF